MSPQNPPFHTLKQLAERWRVCEKTVRRMIASNTLKVHRIGGQIRVSDEDLLTYEKLHRS